MSKTRSTSGRTRRCGVGCHACGFDEGQFAGCDPGRVRRRREALTARETAPIMDDMRNSH